MQFSSTEVMLEAECLKSCLMSSYVYIPLLQFVSASLPLNVFTHDTNMFLVSAVK